MATTVNPLIHSLKLVLMSTGVLFIAILLTPQIFNFTAAQLPTIWTSFRSWLRPPYLYVIINGIIITIAASSRIHHHYKHPHAAADTADEFNHHDVHFRSAEETSDEAYSYDKPKSKPILSLPSEISPFPVPVHETLPSFNFSFADVKLENSSAPEFNKYEETMKFGARETGIDDIDVYDKKETMIVERDQVPEISRNYERPSVEQELVVRRSVRKTQSPSPQPTPLARQETFEIVSSFFQSQMEKPLPSARIDQNRKQSTLTSLATFGGRESREVKKEKVENHDTAFRKTPSPPPRTAPLARHETSEIVSSFFQSQIEKTSPTARFGQNRRESREEALISLNETATFGGVNAASKEEKAVPQWTPSHPPPPPSAPLARQETSEIVSSFFQSQIEKPPASARFGHHRKPTRSTPEGGKALRVAKPKRSETLESTWKTITEGRHMPLTRHLKKSDTWENQGRQPASSDPSSPSIVKKSDTLTDRTSQSAMASAATAKILKKEPSLGQDELNRRVEAFINKVNEEMKLQRQQSMQKFKDTVNH